MLGRFMNSCSGRTVRRRRGLIAQVRAVYTGNVSVAFNGNPFFNDMDR
jgi:hypothetical protein